MLKKQFNRVGMALAIFVGHGHAFMFLLFPFLGLLMKYPALNLFSGTKFLQVMALVPLSGLLLGLAVLLGQKSRLKVGTWLVGMAAYGWLVASVILQPAPVVLWSHGRNTLDQVIVAPIALWVASAGILVVGLLGKCLVLLAEKLRAKPTVQISTR